MSDEIRDEKGKFIKGHKCLSPGRPTNSLSIKDVMRQQLDMKIKDIDPALVAVVAGKDKSFAKKYGNKTLRVALAIAYARKGLQGDWNYLEHLEGKPAQNVNIGNEDGKPLEIIIRHVKPDE